MGRPSSGREATLSNTHSVRSRALFYALASVAVAAAWVFFGDRLLLALLPGLAQDVSAIRGWPALALLPLTGFLVYLFFTRFSHVRSHTDRPLAESERRWRDLCADAPVMYIVTRDEGGTPVIARCNQMVLGTLGYSREELLRRPLAKIFAPESRRELLSADYRRALAGTLPVLTRELVAKDGRFVRVLMHSIPIVDSEGETAGTRIMCVDVTDRLRAEEELRASQERYQDLVENANDIIFTLDLEGNFTSLNKKGKEILEYSLEEISRLNIRDTLTPECAERTCRIISEQLLQPPEGGNTVLEVEFVSKTGRRVPVEVNVRLRGKGGHIVEFHGIARDISERKKLEERLSQAQRIEVIGQLAGGIAHDFNNILTGIAGFSDLALEEFPPSSSAREYLLEISRLSERATRLTRQLLTFSRKKRVSATVVDLNSIVGGTIKLIGRLIQPNIEVRFSPAPELWRVRADAGQVDQVLMNLILNARDALLQGGRIFIETRNVTVGPGKRDAGPEVEPGDYAVLSVRDTGCGMDRETLERVFEPFFTTKGSEKGTGLGLSMVYGIVKQHGGFITVASTPGVGSVFEIYFPRETASREEAAAEREQD